MSYVCVHRPIKCKSSLCFTFSCILILQENLDSEHAVNMYYMCNKSSFRIEIPKEHNLTEFVGVCSVLMNSFEFKRKNKTYFEKLKTKQKQNPTMFGRKNINI